GRRGDDAARPQGEAGRISRRRPRAGAFLRRADRADPRFSLPLNGSPRRPRGYWRNARAALDKPAAPTYKPAAAAARCAGYAQVAQLVEHATENRSVGGSIPPLGTMTNLTDCYFGLARLLV